MRRNRLKLCGAWLPVALLSVGLVRADIWDIDPKRKNEIRLHKIQRWLVPALPAVAPDVMVPHKAKQEQA